jgi:hypothetical protein
VGAELLERARESAAAANLPDEFRWVLWLSKANLQAFTEALEDALVRDLSDDEVAELLADWRATAELDSAPDVIAEIRRPKNYRSLSNFVTS